MQIETVGTLEELASFEAGWNEAVERSSFDSVFSTYEWFSPWIRHYAENPLKIVIAHENTRILAVLPLMQDRKGLRSLSNLQTFKFNLILPRQNAVEVFRRMMDHVNRTIIWDSIQLDFTPDHSGPAAVFRNLGYRVFSEKQMNNPGLGVDGSWDDYWAQRSSNLRKILSYKERRLEREGTLRLLKIENGNLLEGYIRKAFEIERSGWKGEIGTAIACSERDQGFYLELAQTMSKTGRFLLYFLESGCDLIAFSYCLRYKNRLNILKVGYSPDYARRSPGMVLQKKMLQDLYQDPQQTFVDFLGNSEAWKTKWASSIQPLCQVTVFNNKIGPFLLYNVLVARENCKNSIRRYPAAVELLKRSRQLFQSSGGVRSEGENRLQEFRDEGKN